MALHAEFVEVVAVAAAGLALSVVVEGLMVPRPSLLRPAKAWQVHAGLWLLLYGVTVFLLGRPWFGAAVVLALLLVLVLVNNAKMKALREPFVFQDYDYFIDAVRHPRLFIPFLGWGKFFGAAAGLGVAVAVGIWGESVPVQRFSWSGQMGGAVVAGGAGALLLLLLRQKHLPVSFHPVRDIETIGLLACLWRYGEERRTFPVAPLPFAGLLPGKRSGELPHLIAVQSESFFDPRPWNQGIKTNVLANFDQLKAVAIGHGSLKVPAWGANTVRTEFAFLSGLAQSALGMHRFNPYRAVVAGWEAASVASFLKGLGYRTIAIHPYPASFYQRDQVFPRLGFDEFIDIHAFAGKERFGPYVSDAAVAAKVAEVVAEAAHPMFVFVITMENHGPLHLERFDPADLEELYTTPPPSGCEDLTIYLRHLRNSDGMCGKLSATLEDCGRPASLCWFGDHVPIMPSVYRTFGLPGGDVEYVLWRSWNNKEMTEKRDLHGHDLAMEWLRGLNLV